MEGKLKGQKNRRIEAVYEGWSESVARFFTGMTVKERFVAISGFVLTAIVSYFAAKKGIPFLPESAGGGLCRPLGDAILCASGWTAPAAFLGLLYSAYKAETGFVTRAVALSLLFALRTVIGLDRCVGKSENRGFYRVKRGAYRENRTAKIGSAAAFSLLTAGLHLPSLSLTVESLPEVMGMLFATPLLTALICGAFESRDAFYSVNRRVLYSLYREISVYALLTVAVYAFKGQSFMGSSLATVSAIFLTVTTAMRGGTVRGGIMGAVLGYTVSSVYAPIMTVVGIFAGVLGGLGVAATVGISCAAGCFLAVYGYGYRAMLGYIPESIIAAAIASPVVRYGFIGEGFPIPRKRVLECESVASDGEENGYATELEGLSAAFRELSEKRAVGGGGTGLPDIRYVCRLLSDGFCDSCPLVCICWDGSSGGHNNNTVNAVKSRISRIYSVKNGNAADGNEPITAARSRVDDGFVCLRSAELERELIRICESREARLTSAVTPPLGFFGDCLCLSEILGELSEREGERELDSELTVKLKKAVSSLGITADGAAVYGGRMKRAVIYGVNADWGNSYDLRMERIANAISERCGGRFKPSDAEHGGKRLTSVGVDGRGRSRLTFCSVPPLSVDHAFAQRRAAGETENGDTAEGFETDEGFFYSVLCDGMGSGETAANCSENAVKTLKTLLRCGLSPRLSAKLTGDFVKDGYEECFTTLDLLSTDLFSGDATVLKSGAASSYLIRNGEVRVLSAPALPLGISYGAAPERTVLRLKEGDVFVTVSDGVAETEADELWLSAWLSDHSDILGSSADDIAERIISEAENRTSDHVHRDDMTVAVARITASGDGSSAV